VLLSIGDPQNGPPLLRQSYLPPELFDWSPTLFEPSRFTNAISQVIELRSADNARSRDNDLCDAWRVYRELALHTLSSDDSSHVEHFATATATSSDDGSRKNLNPLFLTFENSRVDFDRVADLECRRFRFETALFDHLQ